VEIGGSRARPICIGFAGVYESFVVWSQNLVAGAVKKVVNLKFLYFSRPASFSINFLQMDLKHRTRPPHTARPCLSGSQSAITFGL